MDRRNFLEMAGKGAASFFALGGLSSLVSSCGATDEDVRGLKYSAPQSGTKAYNMTVDQITLVLDDPIYGLNRLTDAGGPTTPNVTMIMNLKNGTQAPYDQLIVVAHHQPINASQYQGTPRDNLNFYMLFNTDQDVDGRPISAPTKILDPTYQNNNFYLSGQLINPASPRIFQETRSDGDDNVSRINFTSPAKGTKINAVANGSDITQPMNNPDATNGYDAVYAPTTNELIRDKILRLGKSGVDRWVPFATDFFSYLGPTAILDPLAQNQTILAHYEPNGLGTPSGTTWRLNK